MPQFPSTEGTDNSQCFHFSDTPTESKGIAQKVTQVSLPDIPETCIKYGDLLADNQYGGKAGQEPNNRRCSHHINPLLSCDLRSRKNKSLIQHKKYDRLSRHRNQGSISPTILKDRLP